MAAYLQINPNISPANRAAATGVHQKYKTPFLGTVRGATSKEPLVRDQGIQVLHGFGSVQNANAHLESAQLTADVVRALQPLLAAAEVRTYAGA